jgi:hypothetical protein
VNTRARSTERAYLGEDELSERTPKRAAFRKSSMGRCSPEDEMTRRRVVIPFFL